MMSSVRTPSFVFDFRRADSVSWTQGPGNKGIERVEAPLGFFINDSAIADEFASQLPGTLADLVDIGVAVHTADRLALRSFQCSGNWGRRMELILYVRSPKLWGTPELKERIERTLEFLTEDVWRLSFVLREHSQRDSELQGHLFPGDRRDFEVSLFSGGLDSFAGTASRALERASHLVLVSASPSPRHRVQQQYQVRALRERFGRPISHVCVPYGIHRGDERAQEPSRRTRGFLFLLLGGVTALLGGASALYLYENGIGAMNLPYDHSQIGADNTRAVHPRALREIAEILSLVAERRFSVENRCVYKTKAEMLRTPAIAQVSDIIPRTFSCDAFPVRARGRAQCGFCTSCLLRRYSLEVAGIGHADSNAYLQNWKLASFTATRHHLRGLQAMNWQALTISKCFKEQAPWQALTFEFPELRSLREELSVATAEPCSSVEIRLARLLRQYAEEWQRFSALELLTSNDTKAA